MQWTPKDRGKWNRWWAWRPVCIDHNEADGGIWIWLEWVERWPMIGFIPTGWRYRRAVLANHKPAESEKKK